MTTADAVTVFGTSVSGEVVIGAAALAGVLLFAAMWFALSAVRSSAEARIARAEAAVKLSAAQELSAEVGRLRAQVEQAVLHHNSAVTNAFLMHNDACAATRSTPMRAAPDRPQGGFLSDAGAHDHHEAAAPHGEDAAQFRARARADALNGGARRDAAAGGSPAFLGSLFSRAKAR